MTPAASDPPPVAAVDASRQETERAVSRIARVLRILQYEGVLLASQEGER